MPVEPPLKAFTVWHPRDGYGLAVPHLYASALLLENHMRTHRLWPLQRGWRVVEVEVRMIADDSQGKMHDG